MLPTLPKVGISLLILGFTTGLFAENSFHFHVNLTPLPDGSVRVREQYRFNDESKLSRIAFTIFTPYQKRRFPLRCKVSNIQIRQNSLPLKPERILQYHQERTTILLKKVSATHLEVQYLLSDVGHKGHYQVYFFPHLEELISATFKIHGTVLSWRTTANELITEKFSHHQGYAKMVPDIETGLVSFKLDFTTPHSSELPPYGTSLLTAVPKTLWLGISLLFLLALGLRFLPPQFSLVVFYCYLGYLGSILSLYHMEGVRYFWLLYEFTNDPVFKENLLLEILKGLAVLVIVLFLAAFFYQNQHNLKPSHWYDGFIIPMVVVIFLPITANSLVFFLLTLSNLTMLFFWFRKKLAFYFGIGIGQLVEEVNSTGIMSIAKLAQKHHLSEKRLVQLVQQLPGTVIAIDYENHCLLSPALLSQQNYQLCLHCGAVTLEKELTVCPWCGANYSQSPSELPTKPIPLTVEILAELSHIIGNSLAITLLLSAIFGIVIDFMSHFPTTESWLSAGFIILLAIFSYYLSYHWQEQLRSARLPGAIIFLLILGSPLILPLVLLQRLFSLRVKLFLVEQEVIPLIQAKLNQQGYLAIDQLATLLRCESREAIEVAHYLSANHLLEAVFERKTAQLVNRQLYQQKAKQNDCLKCGGIRQIKDSKLLCLYCGQISRIKRKGNSLTKKQQS